MANAQTFVVGKVRPSFNGDWKDTLIYQATDMVRYRDEAYMALQDVPVNREPDVATDYWVKIGSKGNTGATGQPGPQGTAGRDGAPGIQGTQGVGPKHRWVNTTLAFENPDGSWSDPADLRGSQGIQGPEGPVGTQGIEGPTGQQGPIGPAGPQGPAGPLPALSSAVDSSSTVTAASSYAVKQAYDKATTAKTTLSDSVSSASSTTAASSYAVKTVYDFARQVQSTVPKLSGAINSTSQATAATSMAVKAAYDKAVEARNAIPGLSSSCDSTATSIAANSYAVKQVYDLAVLTYHSVPQVLDSLVSTSMTAAASANALRIAWEHVGNKPAMPANNPNGGWNNSVQDYAPVGTFGRPKVNGKYMVAPLGGTWAFYIPGSNGGSSFSGVLSGGGTMESSSMPFLSGFMWRIA